MQEYYENVWNWTSRVSKSVSMYRNANLLTYTEKSSDQVMAGNVLFFLQLLWNYELLNAAISLRFISR